MEHLTLDDAALLSLIAEADSEALSALYNRYHRLVFSLALNMVGDHTAAEEVTLDVFIRIWEKADTYRPEQAKVTTWLTSITRYRAIDVLRRRNVRLDSRTVDLADVSAQALPDGQNPEKAAELNLEKKRVRAAIAGLPPDQKEALVLAYFRGYSHSQIAEALNQPLGTIKTRIRLAMKKLRQMLQDA